MIHRKLASVLEKAIKTKEIDVVTGMRRVGKTTLLLYLYQQITHQRKLYLDLENPLNQSYFTEIDYDKIKINLESLAEGRGAEFFIFLDEIQNVKNLPSIVKYLYDHYHFKFILTGSASFYLKNLFTESLAGRKRIFELYPLDFEEFLSVKAPKIKKHRLGEKISQTVHCQFEKYVFEYLTYGGFPSVVLKESHEEKIAEIEDIFTSYYQKEIRLLSDFRKLEIVKATIILLAERVGSKIDYTKLASELGASRITIEEYLDFLENTYFLKRIKPFSRKIDVVLRGQPKFYLGDNAFLTQIGKTAEGVLFENAVFNLIKNSQNIYFYQSKGGAEIDFIVKREDKFIAFEVKTQVHQVDLNRLRRTAQKLGIDDYFVIARKFSPLDHVIFPFQLE